MSQTGDCRLHYINIYHFCLSLLLASLLLFVVVVGGKASAECCHLKKWNIGAASVRTFFLWHFAANVGLVTWKIFYFIHVYRLLLFVGLAYTDFSTLHSIVFSINFINTHHITHIHIHVRWRRSYSMHGMTAREIFDIGLATYWRNFQRNEIHLSNDDLWHTKLLRTHNAYTRVASDWEEINKSFISIVIHH